MFIRIGPFEITPRNKGGFWIRKDGGEAMETSEEKMLALIEEFWKREF